MSHRMTPSEAAATLGRAGRAVNSPAQQAAARANGKRGGRPSRPRYVVEEYAADGHAGQPDLFRAEATTLAEARRIIRHLKGFEPQVAAQLERETGLLA